MKVVFFICLTLFFGCTFSSEMDYVSKKKIEGEKIIIDRSNLKKFEKSDCVTRLLMIPLNFSTDLEKEMEKECGKEWEIFDAKLSGWGINIPFIFVHYCQKFKGLCRK